MAKPKADKKPATTATQPTSSGDPRFDAIVGDVGADAARLAYADAVGGARGELIRLQVARAAGPVSDEAGRRERAILDSKDMATFAGPLASASEGVVFDRGFPVAVRLRKKGGLADVLDVPAWGTVTKLCNIEEAPATAVVKLIESGRLPNLRMVWGIQKSHISKLRAPTYPWTSISMNFEGLPADGLARFPELRELYLSGDGMPAGFLARAEKLECLHLYSPTRAALEESRAPMLRLPFETAPALLAGLPIKRLSLCVPPQKAEAYVDAVPALDALELEAFGTWFDQLDWGAFGRLLARDQLKTLVLRGSISSCPRTFTREAGHWRLVVPTTGVRTTDFHAELASMAPRLHDCGVRALTLFPTKPIHYMEPFSDVTADELAGIEAAWSDVQRPLAYRWADDRAPGEDFAGGPDRMFPSR